MTAGQQSSGSARSTAERLVALEEVAVELAGTLDPQRIAQVIVGHAGRVVGAQTVALYRVAGDEVALLRAVGLHDSAMPYVTRYRLDRAVPLTDAVTGREPLFFTSREDFRRRYPASEERTRGMAEGETAMACIPLLHDGRALGVIAFAFDQDREFDDAERRYLGAIGAHAALALERARLFDAEREARDRFELLYTLASASGSAADLDAIFEPALDAVAEGLAVDRASILLFDAAGVMRFRAWRGLSEDYRRAVDGHSPWSRSAPDPKPIVVADVETDPSVASLRPVLRAEGIRALAFVPLVHERRLLGKFMIYDRTPRALGEGDVRLALAIAAPIAAAVARHEAEEETRRAKSAAEQAATAREQLLSVVAHDLRNPLGVIQLKAQLLLRQVPQEAEDDASRKARRDFETLARNADLMSRLINDLLDVAAIDAGRISVDKKEVRAGDLLGEAIDNARPLAEQRGIRVVVRGDLDGTTALGDRERIMQVFSNLLGNALKFGAQGGEVVVEQTFDAEARRVRFAVEDDGPGIAREERERVFERYVRSEGSVTKGGVGLGLFIARGIVGAHGGKIWIEDRAGGASGTRVVFTLPLAGGAS